MTEVRIKFKNPTRLGQDAALALEDYARVATSTDAVILMDAGHRVTGVSVSIGTGSLADAVTHDIEHFFDSLAREATRQSGR